MPDLIFAEPTESLEKLQPSFLNGWPTPLLRLLKNFLYSIKKLLGISLQVEIPDMLAHTSINSWNGIKTLQILKRLGIVKFFYKGNFYYDYPDEPRLKLWTVELESEDNNRYRGYGGFGCDFFDYETALWPAVGEAVERWALSNFNPSTREYRDAAYKDIKKEGALDIFSVAGYSDKLRKKGHHQVNLIFNEKSIFRWVRGISYITGKRIWIPLQLVSFSGLGRAIKKEEPLILKIISTGAAAHDNLEDAILNGVLEVIQRDAFMIYWISKKSPPIINLDSIADEKINHIKREFMRYNLKVYPLYLETNIPVHTVLAVIVDESGVGPSLCVGAHTGFDFNETVYKAILEAHASRMSVRRLWNKYKKDGKKLDFINKEKIGHKERLLYWCMPEHLQSANFLFQGKEKILKELNIYNMYLAQEKLKFLREFFQEQNVEVFYKELIERKLSKKIGMKAVMVTIPKLQPLHLDESLPCFWGARLAVESKKMGVSLKDIPNRVPHPFP